MPKFLDVPSWYNRQGTEIYGVGVDTNEQPGVGDVPCVHLPSGEMNYRHIMVNGATSGDISIYAPTTQGNHRQIIASLGTPTPTWTTPKYCLRCLNFFTTTYSATTPGTCNIFVYFWTSNTNVSPSGSSATNIGVFLYNVGQGGMTKNFYATGKYVFSNSLIGDVQMVTADVDGQLGIRMITTTNQSINSQYTFATGSYGYNIYTAAETI